MIPTLHNVFSLACSQAPDRSWAPCGEILPYCHRCSGLYLGALAATLTSWVLRVQPGTRRLWFDGLCLLSMVPLGLHWVPHGPELRMISGWAFALGVVDFLWILPSARWGWGHPVGGIRRSWWQLAWASVGLVGAMLAVSRGGATTARAFAWLGFCGLLCFAVLVALNLILLGRDAWMGWGGMGRKAPP